MIVKDLTEAQQVALGRLSRTEPRSAYGSQSSLSTLRVLVRKGYAKDVTRPGAGGMFSPRTHFEFIRIN